tara:strand:+ start:1887 stop:2123 length:237 start_codon:yes stop_codon:yes gene_type:complete
MKSKYKERWIMATLSLTNCGTYFTDENYIFKFINHVLHYAEVKERECNWHPVPPILRKNSSDKEIYAEVTLDASRISG